MAAEAPKDKVTHPGLHREDLEGPRVLTGLYNSGCFQDGPLPAVTPGGVIAVGWVGLGTRPPESPFA